ncbi:hypothetical protein IMSHALPRED_000082 [Imshaugia aleurites]|uniref:Uncharacterized protein n=1 Tax=Imshaugia aleurites TaxID=172621 RepID=A0A8H3I4N3_9LECA|nr:hypothetical protein IMSHALPRED_000082 [Imshaugia aleurites]
MAYSSKGNPPLLYGVVKLDYHTITWSSMFVPVLLFVKQYVDSSSIALARWQRQQAIRQRAKLLQLHCDLEDDDKDGGGPSAEANRDDERARVDIDTEGDDEVEGEVDAEEDFKEI